MVRLICKMMMKQTTNYRPPKIVTTPFPDIAESIPFTSNPRLATKGELVRLLWGFSEYKHHSKAKGGVPNRDREIRALAWVIKKWAWEVRSNVIVLENIEEFKHWGTLDAMGKPIKAHKGDSFRAFIRRIKRLDNQVDWCELRACDNGAPTIRKRLFMIARCDGMPIVWPRPTQGPGLIPFLTTADIIDWTIPCPSIFERKKPLVENTIRRIAKGIQRYVIDTADPFIVPIQHYKGSDLIHSIHEPLRTVTASPKGGAFAVAIPHIQRQFGHSVGYAADQPIGTITAGGCGKSALVTVFLLKYYRTAIGKPVNDPLDTITTKHRFGLVPVEIKEEPYIITDIGMRMLSPRELFRAQGFDESYKIDFEIDSKRITKTDQVRLYGNSVCPPITAAIVKANAGFIRVRDNLAEVG